MVDVVGYGMGFRPRPPFQAGRLPSPDGTDQLAFAHLGDGVTNLLVRPGTRPPGGPLRAVALQDRRDGAAGSPEVLLGVGVGAAAEVAAPVPGCTDGGWWVRTDTYRVPLPDRFAVRSTHPGAPWPFELYTADVRHPDAYVVLRGPLEQAATPAPPQLVAPGQRVLDAGATDRTLWQELGYAVDGVAWWQRHDWVPLGDRVVVVTAQTPGPHADVLRAALTAVVDGLRPVDAADAAPFALTD